jgi:hypothetical protein
LAIVFEGQVLTAPRIAGAIDSPALTVPGNWAREDIERILVTLSGTQSATPNFQFAPTAEYVLPQATNTGDAIFLGLSSGRLLTNGVSSLESREFHEWTRRAHADFSSGMDERHFHAWLKEHNPVAAEAESEPLPLVQCFDMVVVPAGTNDWNTGSPLDVKFHNQLITQEPEKRTLMGKLPGVTDTYYFRNRDDVWGLVQVVGFTDNPRGVKIRYKLVQSETK